MIAAIEEDDYGAFEDAYNSYGEALTKNGFDVSLIVEPALEGAPDSSDYGIWVPGVPALLTNLLEKINCADWIISLVVDGIVGGVGAVLGFVPQMFVLFLFLAFLEACGYM